MKINFQFPFVYVFRKKKDTAEMISRGKRIRMDEIPMEYSLL